MVSIPTKITPNPTWCFTNSDSLDAIRNQVREWKKGVSTLCYWHWGEKNSNIQLTMYQAFHASKCLIHKILLSKQASTVKRKQYSLNRLMFWKEKIQYYSFSSIPSQNISGFFKKQNKKNKNLSYSFNNSNWWKQKTRCFTRWHVSPKRKNAISFFFLLKTSYLEN